MFLLLAYTQSYCGKIQTEHMNSITYEGVANYILDNANNFICKILPLSTSVVVPCMCFVNVLLQWCAHVYAFLYAASKHAMVRVYVHVCGEMNVGLCHIPVYTILFSL